MDLAVLAATFGTIFVVELPDKTFLATLVLATRYRPALVWLGVGLAFAVQTTIAVAVGQAATYLPDPAVKLAAALLFTAGAVLLLREARGHHADGADGADGADRADGAGRADEGAEELAADTPDVSGVRAVLASFLVLFAAEWGDLSQLLTISLVARYEQPLAVFVGALAALLAVSGLAVLTGRTLLRLVRLHVLYYLGAAVCSLLAVLVVVELFR